jgi:polysaccharide pyruvyl transferase WcaK-like protein
MSQKDTILYAHGSAFNHGCEAIVRASAKILSFDKEKTVLYSNRIEGDLKYNLDNVVTIKPIAETRVDHNSPLGVAYRVKSHLHKDHRKYYFRYFGERQYQYLYEFGDVAISIGGDNYCYSSALDGLVVRNYWLNRKGFKTTLWGASLTEEFITPEIVEDLNRYSLISVREKSSYDLLKKYKINTEIVCGPDPAFALNLEDTPWPDGRQHDNIIGINISPFVMECSSKSDIGIKNYVNLIQWILSETNCEIALIPHVAFPYPGSNDIEVAKRLLNEIPNNERVLMLDDRYNCCQLKSLISKCSFFVGARTHATIAAYSTCVPTLVVGYSSKSIGIARDLFGTEEGYVCSVQQMKEENELTDLFEKRYIEKEKMKSHLGLVIPRYLNEQRICVDAMKQLLY